MSRTQVSVWNRRECSRDDESSSHPKT